MTDHGLEVSAVVDLYIDGGSSTGGCECDRSTRADVGEERASIPRCLPLRNHIVSKGGRRNVRTR